MGFAESTEGGFDLSRFVIGQLSETDLPEMSAPLAVHSLEDRSQGILTASA